jgi:hypothetical protein
MATENLTPESDVDLPPMPEPLMRSEYRSIPPRPPLYLFTADQMREYALLAVQKERARCIAACEKVSMDLDEYAEANNYHGDAWSYIEQCITAIRKG